MPMQITGSFLYLQIPLEHHRYQSPHRSRSSTILVHTGLCRMMRSRTRTRCRRPPNMRHLSDPCRGACRMHLREHSRALRGCRRHPITFRLAIGGTRAWASSDRSMACWQGGDYQAPARSWALVNRLPFCRQAATCDLRSSTTFQRPSISRIIISSGRS